jgi:hypothetical protein
VSHEPFVHDHNYPHHLEHYRNGLANDVIDNLHEGGHTDDEHNSNDDRKRRYSGDDSDIIPSTAEQIIIDSWLKLCPSLEVVTLFSGSQWRKELDDREEVWSNV